jgi:hypothetical protein
MAIRKAPIRRAQLIAPFGVGGMLVSAEGISMMTAGLDHWFSREGGSNSAKPIDDNEFRLEEWRLQRHLNVSHLRLPPDFREARTFATDTKNVDLTIPMVRFPQWHFCSNPVCRTLREYPLSQTGRKSCPDCKSNNRRGWMSQVPFVAICDGGHAQDFPWREWVHKSATPTCNAPLRLQSTGGASLSAQEVQCGCGQSRRLTGITQSTRESTYLTRNLSDDGQDYRCRGRTPWHGSDNDNGCVRPLKGSLRAASNVHFSVIRSAIYLPRESQAAPAELVVALEAPHISVFLGILAGAGEEPRVNDVRSVAGVAVESYTDEQISAAVAIFIGKEKPETPEDLDCPSDDRETKFRRTEFGVLRKPQIRPDLQIRAEALADYGSWIGKNFDRVLLVDKLRETRALVGFQRVVPRGQVDFVALKALLRRNPAPVAPNDWLPAYAVFGEGIFLELNAARLREWEERDVVRRRADALAGNYGSKHESTSDELAALTPRFILAHTLAHVLMNRLTFESGYSSAALRERLYVSSDPNGPMAAIMIYTAAGDAEGTMGGLVRMGRPDRLGPALRRSVDEARWCSADPVCMEIGDHGGQGPESCNLAACHNCALVPETACEHFNRFLDRGLLIGSVNQSDLGYFVDGPEMLGTA